MIPLGMSPIPRFSVPYRWCFSVLALSFPKLSPLPSLTVTERQECQSRLSIALWQLGGLISLSDLEQLSHLIMSCLSSPARTYHTLSHVLQVAKTRDAVEVLAGLFHDCVYMQTDGGVNATALPYLAPHIIPDLQGWAKVCTTANQFSDRSFALVAQIFGICPGQDLAGGAANEFLSALFAVKCLQPFLSWGNLAQIAGAIEMTVPFRPNSSQGLPPERLRRTLLQANETFDLGLSPMSLDRAVERAVGVANRDLIGFAHPQVEVFLSQTWSLLPEQHIALRSGSTCSIAEFRKALSAMGGFMQMLKPEVIFQSYNTTPEPLTLDHWLAQAEQNLAIARLYFASRLVTLAVLEALLKTHAPHRVPQTVGDLLYLETQTQPCAPWPLCWINRCERQTLNLLQGRTETASAQVLASPLTARWIQSNRFGPTQALQERATDYFNGKCNATEFLQNCPQEGIRDMEEALELR
jgi:hypothetical protein